MELCYIGMITITKKLNAFEVQVEGQRFKFSPPPCKRKIFGVIGWLFEKKKKRKKRKKGKEEKGKKEREGREEKKSKEEYK